MGITRYTWDVTTDSVLQESDGSGIVQATYTRRPELYGPLLSQYRSGSTSYYHFDALGSTRALTDDSQTVTDSYTYDAWGNGIARTGTTSTPFRWVGNVGYYYDTELGSFYIRARQYLPMVARWASVDPLSWSTSLQPYIYVMSYSLMSMDPSGQGANEVFYMQASR